MPFGRKRDERSSGGSITSALVVATDHPLDNRLLVGSGTGGTVQLLIDPGGEHQTRATGSFKLGRDRWLVVGMEIPVRVDPARPDDFEPDWDAIPSIEERVAAGDPTLADPLGTRRRVREASNPGAEPGAGPDRFAEALERAGAEPAPAGRTRAVVLVPTLMATVVSGGGGGSGDAGHERITTGKREAVLSVNVPGRDPYVVLERKFKRPKNKADLAGAGLPALVSATDPSDIEILWDEVPSTADQVSQRIADRLGAAQTAAAAPDGLEQQVREAAKQASAQPPPEVSRPGAVPRAGMPTDMQGALAQSARMALSYVKDPRQRKQMIEQYRRAGLDVSEFEDGS